MEATPFTIATAEQVRAADKAEVRLSAATVRKAVQALTDRLILKGMF